MPHLVQMDKRYGKKGLQLIGAHVQGGEKDKIVSKVEDLKMKFPVTEGISGPSLGATGIPHLMVFDVTGKLVFSGHPMNGADKVIKKELRKVPADGSDSKGFGLPERLKDDTRDWTNTEGKTIQAAFVSSTEDKVMLKLKNGKEVNYPMANLSEADQAFIKTKKAE